MNYQLVILSGRLTKNPETKTTQSGTKVANLSVATSRHYTSNGEKKEDTEFHDIVAFGKLAEIIEKYLVKGQVALFKGYLKTQSWDKKDGSKGYRTEIIAEEMQMGQKPKSQEDEINVDNINF